ncbi:protein of unknown function [Streptococcus sanguinis]|uniref:Uncharacterized protein n=1 Tax=Streptococcus sanguinis TaxID=1305 RepID=A0A0B7GR25_STRSA|nr:protein of unknown function [Streptococcus sanguinis]
MYNHFIYNIFIYKTIIYNFLVYVKFLYNLKIIYQNQLKSLEINILREFIKIGSKNFLKIFIFLKALDESTIFC